MNVSGSLKGQNMQTREQILEQHRKMQILFQAWISDKEKREVLTYRRENGDLIEHYPNGEIKVLEYAKQ